MKQASLRALAMCLLSLAWICSAPTHAAAEFTLKRANGVVTDRFDPRRPAVDQLRDYASLVGVPSSEISSAMWDGRFAPHQDDVERALAEVAYDEMEAVGLAVDRSRPWWNQFNRNALARAFPNIDLTGRPHYLGHVMRQRIMAGWATRFGPIPEPIAVRVAQTMNDDPAALDYWLNHVREVHSAATLAIEGHSAPIWSRDMYAALREKTFLPALQARFGRPPDASTGAAAATSATGGDPPESDAMSLSRLRTFSDEELMTFTLGEFFSETVVVAGADRPLEEVLPVDYLYSEMLQDGRRSECAAEILTGLGVLAALERLAGFAEPTLPTQSQRTLAVAYLREAKGAANRMRSVGVGLDTPVLPVILVAFERVCGFR